MVVWTWTLKLTHASVLNMDDNMVEDDDDAKCDFSVQAGYVLNG